MSRISPGTMTAAIFAILIGLAGAYAVRQYLKKPPEQPVVEAPPVEEAPAPRPQMVYVPTVARDTIKGRRITLNDIVVHRFTKDEFGKSEFAKMSFMPDTNQIIGRTLRNPLEKNSVFQPTDFYSDGEGPGVAELLKPGFRAVTVSIKNIGAVEGFARPGSAVDVLYRADAQDDTPEVTMTLLESVEVLAVGTTAVQGQTVAVGNGQGVQDGSVTLAVTPHQAKALKVVEGHGELTLALRHPDDVAGNLLPVKADAEDGDGVQVQQVDVKQEETTASSDEKLTLERLVGLKPVQPKPKKREIEIFRGTNRETITFATPQEPKETKIRFGGLIPTPIAGNPQVNRGNGKPGNDTTLKSNRGAEESPSGSATPPPPAPAAAVVEKEDGGS